MPTARRTLIAGLAAAPLLPLAAHAQDADPRLGERSIGKPDAPVTVIEYFSLTCGHCAAFHRDTWPRVKAELVDTGRMRMVWRDFPLDQLALAAAAVARALPAERYEPFIGTLLSTQNRWAFNSNGDPREELFRMAAFAGMNRATFDATLADQALLRAILEARLRGQQQHGVSSTPTFVFGSNVVPGNMPFDNFAQLVAGAR